MFEGAAAVTVGAVGAAAAVAAAAVTLPIAGIWTIIKVSWTRDG
jgi:hypothetical protein